ncbi:MAG: methyltransferase domain-containing protein [Blastocatellia bacterium]|nr:methyltransferase domain-containing protein [Blastocatellia bacterium]
MIAQSIFSMRARWISAVLCAAIVSATVGTSLAFQDTRAVNAGNPSTLQDFKAGDAYRAPYQNATALVAALKVSRGDWVADVGAGGGYYSMRLAEIVGTEGKVFAEDISDSSIRWLNDRVKVFNLSNVEIIKGTSDDPKLPVGRLDAVLVVDAYHHFSNYEGMLDKILHSLKPGGRLVIADYSFAGHRAQSRADQLKLHEIAPELTRKEVETAGFDVVKCEDPFAKWKPGHPRVAAADLWLMTATRPK